MDRVFNGAKASVGIVIRDNMGDVIASMAAPLQGIIDAAHAEAMAIWKCLELVRDIGLTQFVVESDCVVLAL